MQDGQASRTADRVAAERAAHQLLDRPLILDDPLAVPILSAGSQQRLREQPQTHHGLLSRITRSMVVVRSRIAEDEIAAAAARGATQYVVLGAGFDTFAYRPALPQVSVFEVDHPATQRLKRERLAHAGIDIPPRCTMVSIDFDRESLAERLADAGFDRARPAVFAWLGVVMYLETARVYETLRYIAAIQAPVSVVFDYARPPESLPWLTQWFYHRALGRLSASGEPWRSFFLPESLRAELLSIGFTDVEDLGAGEIDARFLAGRTDGLKAGSVGRIAIARRHVT
jgi:methyltransferase (TIGR00027 family)